MVSIPHLPPDPFATILAGIANARVDAAAAARARRHGLDRQAEEGASLFEHLTDLAERGADVRVVVAGGLEFSGSALGAGDNSLALQTPVGLALVAVPAIVSIATADRETPRRGRGHDARSCRVLADVARDLVPSQLTVVLHTRNGDHVRGELVAVGEDAFTVHAAGARRIVVAAAAVVALTVLDGR